MTERSSESPALTRHEGYLLSWLALAVLNAGLILVMLRTGTPKVRLLHHFYDAGQFVAAGLVLSGATKSWERYGPWRARLGWVFAASVAAALGALLLAEDLEGLGAFLVGEERALVVATPLGALLGSTLVGAYAVSHRLARPRLRWLAVAIGAAIAIANGLVLARLYPRIHLLGACWAAALIGGALQGAALRVRASPRAAKVVTLGYALASLWGAAAVVLAPPSAVVIRLLSLPSSALAPLVAELRASLTGFDVGEAEWAGDRSGLPDVPPTMPALLPADRIIVVVLVVDCLRADLVNDKELARSLPAFAALRDQSINFAHAWSPAPATAPSVVGMFTGRHYSQIYWEKRGIKVSPFADTNPRFPELLAAAGIPTVEIAGLRVFTNEWGLVRGSTEELVAKEREAPAAWIVDQAIARMARQAEQPLFMHAHFMEAHAPYNKGGKRGSDFERFVRELQIVDREVARLVAWIDTSPTAKRTVLLLTADHGEAFGEHNTHHHASTLYEELLHVPLLIRAPGVAPRTVTDAITHLDIGPTILDLFGRPTPASFLGQSLVPYLRGATPKLSRPIAAESGRFMRAMLFPDGIKVIHDWHHNVIELYDLRSDPAELTNLYDESNEEHRARFAKLQSYFRAHEFRKEGYKIPYRR